MVDRDVEQLDLAAFRFVAGEMMPDEAAGFEQQLADDQSTREAVCRAVALTQKLFPPPDSLLRDRGEQTFDEVISEQFLDNVSVSRVPVAFTRVARPVSWMTLGAIAASLAFVVAGRVSPESADHRAEQRVANNSSPQHLALPSLDANQIDTLAWIEMSDVTRWNVEPVWPDKKQAAPELLSALDAPTTIPDWILEATGDIE